MCGIVATLSSRRPVSSDALHRATRSLRHRGPDAERVWTSRDCRVGLGHTRLSIIDLETGDQPIANEDGRLRIVANGEFYDFERIRGDLEQKGHAFATRSDSEIALHLFEDVARSAFTRCAESSRSRSGMSATGCCSRREIS
jgi:asparagine synthase (glutamine-hydrolysing)